MRGNELRWKFMLRTNADRMRQNICSNIRDVSVCGFKPKMECFECGYETKRTTDWQRHLKSVKHHEITGLHCACGNKYRSTSALRRHEKTCLYKTTLRLAREQAERDDRIAKEQRRLRREQMRIDEEKEELLEMYRKDQIRLTQKYMDREDEHAEELKKLYVDMAARPSTVNNTTFNLAFFLNETCKNAQTIEQFMGSIPLLMNSDQSMGQHILDNLNKCAVEDRPIHCTDLKRGKLAVKNGANVWEQDQKKVDPLVILNVNTLRQRCLRHLTNVWCPEHPE